MRGRHCRRSVSLRVSDNSLNHRRINNLFTIGILYAKRNEQASSGRKRAVTRVLHMYKHIATKLSFI